MSRKVVVENNQEFFIVRATHADGTTGIISGAHGHDLVFSSEKVANKFIAGLSGHYSLRGVTLSVEHAGV